MNLTTSNAHFNRPVRRQRVITREAEAAAGASAARLAYLHFASANAVLMVDDKAYERHQSAVPQARRKVASAMRIALSCRRRLADMLGQG